MSDRKKVLLRLDPALHDALAGWGADELRSTNAQIEFLLRRAAGRAGRLMDRRLPADHGLEEATEPPVGQVGDFPGGQVQQG